MLLGGNPLQETHYDILSVKEDATYDEIRAKYRSAILDSHPDKLQNTCEAGQDRFLKVHKAWEILSDSRSRALYDSELQDSRRDIFTSEDVGLENMMVEDGEDVLHLYYECRCGDYFSIDSLELGEMGYSLSTDDGNEICLRTPDDLSASIVVPCSSCSLKISLVIKR